MNDGVYFADVDLPFHVWVREKGASGYRWVLREAPWAQAAAALLLSDPDESSSGAAGSSS